MILVTGGTSQVGIVLLRELVKKGQQVRCLIRSSSDISDIKDLNVEFLYGDIDNPESLKAALEGVEYFVHIAGIWRARTILDACRDNKALRKIIFIGSTSRFKKMDSIDEEERNLALKMAQAEELIATSRLNTVVLRPTMLYGLDKDKNILQIIHFMNKFRFYPLIGKGNALKHPIYVGDVVNAILLCISNENITKGDYIIAGREPIRYKQMLKLIKTNLGKKVFLAQIPIWMASFLFKIYKLVRRNSYINQAMIKRVNEDIQYDITPAIRDFGFSPVTFEEGIGKQFEYLTNKGYFKR